MTDPSPASSDSFSPAGGSASDRIAALLRDYKPQPGIPDELLDWRGDIKPLWRTLIRRMADMPPEEMTARAARAEQYLRDTGMYHRQYGPESGAERDWPLSHMPMLMDETEWDRLTQGLMQRADLLEEVMADLYGPNRLVAEGWLPPQVVAENPEWLRPMVGVKPRSGHYLHYVAFDVGRGPDGEWWVLSDRTQAPSGSGFALETRIATTRAFNDIYSQARVHRLAGFYRAMRESLQALRGPEAGRIAILTPGVMNENYLEHAYIARYLGLLLVEGEDLVVRKGRVMVRTISGLEPVSVLWRRMDSNWADPLELNPASKLGSAGMVGALRAEGVTMVNALGSGVVETRAFLAFLPRICRAMRGETLMLPKIATWWCGHAAERDYVTRNAGRMAVSRALSTRLPFDLMDTVAVGGEFRGAYAETEKGSLKEWIDANGPEVVGQEAVTLSTAPAFVDGALKPRPISLRIFLIRTPDGWRAMRGGFLRVGRSADPGALALQQGGSVADLWVVARGAPDIRLCNRRSADSSARRPCCLHGRRIISSGSGAMWSAPKTSSGCCGLGMCASPKLAKPTRLWRFMRRSCSRSAAPISARPFPTGCPRRSPRRCTARAPCANASPPTAGWRWSISIKPPGASPRRCSRAPTPAAP